MARNRAVRLKRKLKPKGSYGKMMKTLLLQNQQIIIQQQNMMFMVMKQFQHQTGNPSTSLAGLDALAASTLSAVDPSGQQQQISPQTLQQLNHHQQQRLHQMQQALQQVGTPDSRPASQQQQHSSINANNNHHHQQTHHSHHQHNQHQAQQFTLQADPEHPIDQEAFQTQQLQQQQLQESLGNYLTPAASEQDPITDKTEEEELANLLEGGDVLLGNNVLYNPQTDIGQITPCKILQPQQQTPSYYSSGCESLNTPRIEQQQQQQQAQQQQKQPPANISQNVVKNLADSFKSPTKPKINVQIVSGSASMKNNKAKIIQRMNISDFLRHVHPSRDNKDQ